MVGHCLVSKSSGPQLISGFVESAVPLIQCWGFCSFAFMYICGLFFPQIKDICGFIALRIPVCVPEGKKHP